jgi:predicted neuraminidase
LLPAYDDLLSRNLFYLSEDGHRWSVLNAVPTVPATIQASVVTLPGGRLLAALRNREFGDLLVIASDDQGDSWSSPTGSGFPSPDSGAALCRLASGNLLLVYNDSPSDRVRLTAALSADEGLSWPCRCRLTGEEEVCSYPAAAQAPDGLVHIVFSVGRERIDHIACNEAWLTSPEAQVP